MACAKPFSGFVNLEVWPGINRLFTMSDRALILAGGRGTRLRPYTVVLPKPLMPIGEYPILEVVVRQLAQKGFGHITIAVNHQANLIQAFFQDGEKWNVKIDYSMESIPLSTIAPLTLISDLPEHFLLMNGDVLTDLDVRALYEQHVAEGRLFTIAASSREQTTDYGVLHANAKSHLVGFEEKPVSRYLVSMGLYMVSKSILKFIPPGRKYGFDELMLDLLAKGEKVHVHTHKGYWLDIGRPDDYMKAIDDFETGRSSFLLP
jgi:NDP-sugar pyrophosphorylase family protein